MGKGIFADLQRIKNMTTNPSAASSAASDLASKSRDPNLKMLKQGLQLLETQSLGLFPGDYFRENWIEALLQQKTGIAYITFAELAALKASGKEEFNQFKSIYLTGVNLATGQIEVFSAETTRDMIISDALRITMSVPILFKPHAAYSKHEGRRCVHPSGHLYVDGGLLDNYPIWIFDKACYVNGSDSLVSLHNPHTLGMRLVNDEAKTAYQQNAPLEQAAPTTTAAFVWQLIQAVLNKQDSDHVKYQEQSRTIYIDHLGIRMEQFDLSVQQQQDLIQSGQKAVEEFFRQRPQPVPVSPSASALVQAVQQGDTIAVQQHLATHAPSDEPLLDIAYQNNQHAMILTLVQHGIYTTQQPEVIRRLLQAALHSDFIDQKATLSALEKFTAYHHLQLSSVQDIPERTATSVLHM